MDLYFIIEVLAVVFGLIYIWLLIKERIECWIFGILGSLLSIFLFVHTKLYSEAILYSYYVVVGFYGYYLWSRKSKDDSLLRISDVNPTNHVYYILSSCVLAFSLAWFFNTYTDAERPYIDSFTTVFSFLATFLEAKKVLSSWKYWIVINGFTIGLYFDKGLDIYAGLILVYFIMSFVGYFKWKKLIA